MRELRRAYYAAMSYADDNVGRVLGALNDGQLNGARNLRDSTIVCAWSDHGYSLGEHGLTLTLTLALTLTLTLTLS